MTSSPPAVSSRLRSVLWAAVAVCVTAPSTVLVMRWRASDSRAASPASSVALSVAQDYLTLGYTYLQRNRPTESLLPLTEAARLDPRNDAVQNNLCFANQLLGRTAEARKACEQALKLNPANQLARNNLAWVNGPASAAAPPQPVAAPAQPAAASPVVRPEDDLLQRGLALYQRGEYQQSIDVWQQVLAVNPNSGRAFNNIGTAQMKLGQYEQAQGMFRRALSLEPGVELYRNNLAWAESELAKRR